MTESIYYKVLIKMIQSMRDLMTYMLVLRFYEFKTMLIRISSILVVAELVN